MAEQPITYRDSGVDIDTMNEALLQMREHVRQTYTPEVLTDIGSFGGIFALNWKSYEDPVLVSSIDGVGTKIKVALMSGTHDTVGADLVNHCVNDILVQGARPLFFMDYFATGKLNSSVVVDVVKGLSSACKAVGCALLGGETAEMPGMYSAEDYDLAGCIVGVVDRNKIVDGSDIEAGDAVVGLGSSGLHTNGFSLARKVLFESAGLGVDSVLDELNGKTIGKTLLEPHRCYANSVLPLLEELPIKGMAHITGGGFYDNIPRILPVDCSVTIDRRLWTPPPIFEMIQRLGNVPDSEMYRTFNMGIGYILIMERSTALEAITRLTSSGEMAGLIGEVHRGVHEVDII